MSSLTQAERAEMQRAWDDACGEGLLEMRGVAVEWFPRLLAHIEALEAVVEAAKAVGGLTAVEVILSVSEPEVVERIDAGLKQLSVALQRLQEEKP